MVRFRLSASVFIIALVLTLGACDKTIDSPGQKKTPARGQKELLIGLIPEQNVYRQRERYLVLRKCLSERLGTTVNFISLSRYGNIIDRFVVEKMDGAFSEVLRMRLPIANSGSRQSPVRSTSTGRLPITASSLFERTAVSAQRLT